MRKKVKNELKDMVANVDWANDAPDDNENNCAMAYPLPFEPEPSSANIGVAKAILTARPNSHPFPERTLILKDTVKIGRSVAKSKAATDNAIFDCKVLSRHHASLWYENGHFFLMDTKSSNGTFVNCHRLSEGSKESKPHEVYSGDTVQFGVDVMENSCSVTHECIVATLRLFLPDGKETKASQNTPVKSPMYLDDLYLLNKFIQEAVHRELLLESKLLNLQRIVESCRGAVATSWHALVCEEHLLTRVKFLERRLAAADSNNPPNELQKVLDDKHKYMMSVNDALRTSHQEKVQLLTHLSNSKLSVRSLEKECGILRSHGERVHQDLQALSKKHLSLERDMWETQQALLAAEKLVSEEKQKSGEMSLQQDNRFNSKAENSENGFKEESLENGTNDWIIDNKSWSLDGDRFAALADTGQPPEMDINVILNQVAEKSGNIKDLTIKLYLLKNELWRLENNRLYDKYNDNATPAEDASQDSKDKVNESDIKEVSNTDTAAAIPNADEPKQNQDTSLETNNHNNTEFDDCSALENANDDTSKEMKTKQLREEIKKVSEQILVEEALVAAPTPKEMHSLEAELSRAQQHIGALTQDLNAANLQLENSYSEAQIIKQEKKQLIYEKEMLERTVTDMEEQCWALSSQISKKAKEEKSDEHSDSKYKEETEELQTQLTKETESKSNNVKEIERLTCRISELQSQLDRCPRPSEMEELAEKLKTLQQLLDNKEQTVVSLNEKIKDLMKMQHELQDKMSQLKQLQSDSVSQATEIILMSECDTQPDLIKSSDEQKDKHLLISSSLSAADLMWDRPDGAGDSSFRSISVDLQRMTELEEELVATKEKWSHVNDDRTQLASELQSLTEKYNKLASRSVLDTLMYVLPLAAILIYVLLYKYIS